MKTLSESRTILKVSTDTERMRFGTVPFTQDGDEEDDEQRLHHFDMDKSVWEDMGSPETITLTIEPGDKLNEEAE